MKHPTVKEEKVMRIPSSVNINTVTNVVGFFLFLYTFWAQDWNHSMEHRRRECENALLTFLLVFQMKAEKDSRNGGKVTSLLLQSALCSLIAHSIDQNVLLAYIKSGPELIIPNMATIEVSFFRSFFLHMTKLATWLENRILSFTSKLLVVRIGAHWEARQGHETYSYTLVACFLPVSLYWKFKMLG